MNKYFRATHVILVIFTAVLLLQSGCAVNPVTGKKEIMLISESMEVQMGQEIDRGLRMEFGIYDDPQLNAYIAEIGQKITPYTHRTKLQYHFAILDTPVENAFAAPGGYIYITRGLLALMNSEAEMATVLGHELGHVNARHSARQMTRAILFQLGIALASELSKDFRKIAPISMIATQLLFLKYSRDDEYQADSLGIEYALKTGYAAGEMVTFFSSLERLSSSQGGGHIPNFLSTHPLTPRRIEKAKELLQSEEYSRMGSTPQLAVNRNGYLNRLNGLVYGNNPRQGYVEGNAFYHPDMRFYFQVPTGWKISNTPLQVTLGSPDGKAVILLKAENTNEALDGYTRKMMKEFTNPQVIREGYRYINGMDAYHTLVAMVMAADEEEEQSSDALNIQISCIRKGGLIYTFFSAAAQNDYPYYQSTIERTIGSFNELQGARYINRNPHRIVIRRARQGQTLRSLLTDMAVPSQNWNQTALINGLTLEQTLTSNQFIKIIK